MSARLEVERLIATMHESVDGMLALRAPLPTLVQRDFSSAVGKAALATWSSHDGTPESARCSRCRKHFLIVTDISKIAETGTCKWCSLPEVVAR